MENLEKSLVEIDQQKGLIIKDITSLTISTTPEAEQATALTQRVKEEIDELDELEEFLTSEQSCLS